MIIIIFVQIWWISNYNLEGVCPNCSHVGKMCWERTVKLMQLFWLASLGSTVGARHTVYYCMLINYKGQAAGGGLQTVSSGRVDSSVEVTSNVSRREGLEVLVVVLKSHKSITSPCTACSAAGVPIVPVPERVAHAAPCPAAPGGCAAGGHTEHPRAATPAPCSPPRGPRWRAARRCGPPGGGRWWWRSPSAGGPGGLPRGGAALARSPSAPAAPAPRGPRRQWLLLPAPAACGPLTFPRLAPRSAVRPGNPPVVVSA